MPRAKVEALRGGFKKVLTENAKAKRMKAETEQRGRVSSSADSLAKAFSVAPPPSTVLAPRLSSKGKVESVATSASANLDGVSNDRADDVVEADAEGHGRKVSHRATLKTNIELE